MCAAAHVHVTYTVREFAGDGEKREYHSVRVSIHACDAICAHALVSKRQIETGRDDAGSFVGIDTHLDYVVFSTEAETGKIMHDVGTESP